MPGLGSSAFDSKRLVDFLPASLFGWPHKHTLTVIDDADPATNLSAVALYFDPDGAAGERLVSANAGSAPGDVVSNPFADMSAGTPDGAQVGALKVPSIEMGTNGDEVAALIATPKHWDLERPIGFRVMWASASATAADTVTWKVFHKGHKLGAALAAPSVALDTVITEDTVGVATANLLQASPRGIMAASKLGADDFLLGLLVEMDAKAAGLDEALSFLGLLVDYVPHFTDGRRVQNDPGV